MEVIIGDSLTVETTVTEDKLAVNVGSGDLRVFATPMAVALMEIFSIYSPLTANIFFLFWFAATCS